MTYEELAMSPTMEHLFRIAQSNMPVDTKDPESLKSCFSELSTYFIQALDGERIHFLEEMDQGMFFGLMAVITDIALDGKLKTSFTSAQVH